VKSRSLKLLDLALLPSLDITTTNTGIPPLFSASSEPVIPTPSDHFIDGTDGRNKLVEVRADVLCTLTEVDEVREGVIIDAESGYPLGLLELNSALYRRLVEACLANNHRLASCRLPINT
jgi:hypothetical protein